MSPTNIVSMLRNLGVTLRVHNGNVQYKPKSSVPPDMQVLLHEHRDAVARELLEGVGVIKNPLSAGESPIFGDVAGGKTEQAPAVAPSVPPEELCGLIRRTCEEYANHPSVRVVGTNGDRWALPDDAKRLLAIYRAGGNEDGEAAAVEYIEAGQSFLFDVLDPQAVWEREHPMAQGEPVRVRTIRRPMVIDRETTWRGVPGWAAFPAGTLAEPVENIASHWDGDDAGLRAFVDGLSSQPKKVAVVIGGRVRMVERGALR